MAQEGERPANGEMPTSCSEDPLSLPRPSLPSRPLEEFEREVPQTWNLPMLLVSHGRA